MIDMKHELLKDFDSPFVYGRSFIRSLSKRTSRQKARGFDRLTNR